MPMSLDKFCMSRMMESLSNIVCLLCVILIFKVRLAEKSLRLCKRMVNEQKKRAIRVWPRVFL